MKIQLNSLSKKYGKKTALDNISLSLSPGIYGLLGPNGAGKSTLMGILSGNITSFTGQFLVNGVPLNPKTDSFYTHLGYVPQSYSFYPEFTAYEFLDYLCGLKQIPKRERSEVIVDALSLVDLQNTQKDKIQTFSGGMKQRLLIAQAIMDHPHFLILDEPTSGLDPGQRIHLKEILRSLADNTIILLATHIVSDIEQLAEYIICIKDGIVVCQGSMNEILSSIPYASLKERSNLTDLELIYAFYLGAGNVGVSTL